MFKPIFKKPEKKTDHLTQQERFPICILCPLGKIELTPQSVQEMFSYRIIIRQDFHVYGLNVITSKLFLDLGHFETL